MAHHAQFWRAVSALTVTALSATALAAGPAANAAPIRSSSTATDTTYLADTLGLPTNTVVETLTYDRFQWLLEQPGDFAILIGDPAEGTNFSAQAQAVDTAARAAGVGTVYWFDPNLSGSVKVGNYTEPNLDIRNPAGITSIDASASAIYGKAWTSLIGQHLGNGLKATVSGANSESATVAIASDPSVINDFADPLYDYSAGTPANATDSVFFVYNKDNTTGSPIRADKIVDGIDLDTIAPQAYTSEAANVLATVGGTNIDEVSEFEFWKSEINAKHAAQASAGPVVAGESILDDADNADPWAITQLTYPELVHLLALKDTTNNPNFVVFFGGTWCPNTRAVIKDVNAQAQANNTTVYNFDTVLDGGTVGGATTSGTNPIQVRNNANNGSVKNFSPSFLYGDLVRTYLKNLVTQYEPNTGTRVLYYPGGDYTATADVVRKLQVPFLINYQRGTGSNPSSTSVKRQWIQQNTDSSTGLPTFTEYMSQFWYTHPEAGRIGLTAAKFPLALTIPGLAGFDWKSPTYPNASVHTDDSAYLDPAATDATTTPAALAAALAAIPSNVPHSTAEEVTASLAAAQASVPVNETLVSNLTIVKDDWALVQTRKGSVSDALANVAFGLEAVAKLDTFFGGLPGAVTSTQTVSAPSVAYGVAPSVTVAIENAYGRVPSGTVTLTVGGATYTQQVSANAASFKLPKLAAGSYGYTLSYPGDSQLLAFTKTGSLVVTKATVSKVATAFAKRPTSTAAGTAKVTVTTPTGLAKATGKVTVTLAKGSTKTKVTGTFSGGSATISVPKLAAGTWSVATAWPGDTNYKAVSTTSTLTVAKAKATKVVGTVSKKPTSKKAGAYKVTVATPAGLAKATGKVTVTLKKGSSTKTIRGSLSKGVVKITVPKLAKGTWRIVVAWPGDANYLAASTTGTVKVTK